MNFKKIKDSTPILIIFFSSILLTFLLHISGAFSYIELKLYEDSKNKKSSLLIIINREKVLNAIKILFESIDEIEIFNKKAIYLYIREITGLNTKQVVNNLNKLRRKYFAFKKVILNEKGDIKIGYKQGNIVITIKEIEHPFFIRTGDDLVIKLDITLKESLLGVKKNYII